VLVVATYIMSDLHGCYEEWQNMLQIIQFNDSDTLYIIGDVLNRGPKPLTLLSEIRKHPNMHLLLGNHEDWFLSLMDVIDQDNHNYRSPKARMDAHNWLYHNGGEATADEFDLLSRDEKKELKQYLSRLPIYMNITVNGQVYLLVHSGFSNMFSREYPMEHYTKDILLWSYMDINGSYYTDKTVIVGHIPTFQQGKEHAGKIIRKNGQIHVDCGCCFGYTLGCIRLEDMQEFYVQARQKTNHE